MHMMSLIKVCSSTTYHILLVKFKELPIELLSQAYYGLSRTACPPIPLLVSQ